MTPRFMSAVTAGSSSQRALHGDVDDLTAIMHLVFSSIVKDYSCVGCHRAPQQSSITTVVQSHKWGVSYAPAPSDIIWSVST